MIVQETKPTILHILGIFHGFCFQDYGLAGVLRGATDSFFGFLGFDAVCALATETKDDGAAEMGHVT